MFDCVLPTRIARNGTCMTSQGRLVVKMPNMQEIFVRLMRNVIVMFVVIIRGLYSSFD